MPTMPVMPEVDFPTTWRVGLLVPSSNSVMEVDFYRSLPHDTTLHTGRMYLPDLLPANVDMILRDSVLSAARSLGTVLPHIIVFGSTRPYRVRGKAYDDDICARIAATTNAEVVSTAQSINQALHGIRAARVAVVTPYTDDVNHQLRTQLETEGFQVPVLHGMGIADAETASITAESIYAFVQSRLGPAPAVDALYVAGTNCHAMSALSLLKVSYDIPIVTANFATLQAVKHRLHALRDRGLNNSSTQHV